MKILNLASLSRSVPRRPTPVSLAMLIIMLVGIVLTAPNGFDDESITDSVLAAFTSHEGVYVSRVVDGDTIKVSIEGEEETVRLIGIDAPESVDPRKPVECFGIESSQHLSGLLTAQSIELQSDSSQADKDRYGRLLRYVYLDGENINEQMIADGYAFEYTYQESPYLYQEKFRQAQQNARVQELGLWARGACE